ncbi:siroheme synthase CysG [Rhizobium sp. CECT 9324]|uniref:siroheme synthase CysG n=1 Tax=Rhizobium sp. CECT 9324 TaxID=2845820 RepID=UPI001E633F6E|nr:siroheme synthase CysG [Rhizobium sp. CECT 9324]CAH0342189.1 Siroheme synthase [Rhizobium sp. CECT 9324]
MLATFSQPNERPRPERVAPLAKLPVFWALEGKTVIVAGGTDGAAWKAELLAACGALVHVYCPEDELSEVMASLIDAHSPADEPISPLEGEMSGRTDGGSPTRTGGIVCHPHHWHADIFKNASLALADCETDEEAESFHTAARAAGVPVNVIDKPAFCQFQFGSIVNRSPVIVSISTDGAAPILAQAIRRRIETLLPQALKGWAELARDIRERVNERLAPGPQRRTFWERFVDHTFASNQSPEEGVERVLLTEAESLSEAPATGRVTLVGAGPGDAELLTLKAVRALQSADVILFDDLVSSEVLELARREAKRMLVGKRGGRESCKQDDINAMMVNFAKAGKRVVRLKSGDPMIFGRAGEEIARLQAEGIPVDVVPGITAASAMASALGISLTHRDHAQSVRFVTGHSRHGDLPANTNWASLADPTVTTVFYMGGRTAEKISEALGSHGMPPSTPAVIVTSVTRPNERRWSGTLDDLAEAVAIIGVDEPILIGIGNAFAARAKAPVEKPLPHSEQQEIRVA